LIRAWLRRITAWGAERVVCEESAPSANGVAKEKAKKQVASERKRWRENRAGGFPEGSSREQINSVKISTQQMPKPLATRAFEDPSQTFDFCEGARVSMYCGGSRNTFTVAKAQLHPQDGADAQKLDPDALEQLGADAVAQLQLLGRIVGDPGELFRRAGVVRTDVFAGYYPESCLEGAALVGSVPMVPIRNEDFVNIAERMVPHVRLMRSASNARCVFYREGSLVSTKNTVLLV
jgi:hypothetical protein